MIRNCDTCSNPEYACVCDPEKDAMTVRMFELENALRACIARAGWPDPVEACRLVIKTAEEALRK